MQEFDQATRQVMLTTAHKTIEYGVSKGIVMPIEITDYPSKLQQTLACFVTIHKNGALRGCIGSLQAHQPLIQDLVHNAFNAAFADPRFTPIIVSEMPLISLDISVLSKPVPMKFSSEADLLSQLRPGIDGLILSDLGRRGTFLPSVWEQLPNPVDFLSHLKVKAGLPVNHWSNTLHFERYTTELIS